MYREVVCAHNVQVFMCFSFPSLLRFSSKHFYSVGELVAAIARQMTPEVGRHQMVGEGQPYEETSSPTPTGGRKMSIDERIALMRERKASEEISQAPKSELMSLFARRSQSPSVEGKRREGGREGGFYL